MARDFMSDKKTQQWIAAAEHNKGFPYDFMEKAAEHGLLGMNVSEKYGGAGMSVLDAVTVIEEIAYWSVPFSLNILVQNSLAAFPIETFGTEEQKAKYLPKMVSGELLGCFANTEAGVGSDAKNIVTKAVRKDGKLLLIGFKRFITSASVANVAVVFARTSPRTAGNPGTTAFLIDIGENAPGFLLTKVEKKYGQSGSMLCEFILDDYVADEKNILGKLNQGWEVCDGTFRHSRNFIAAQGAGLARRALDEALKYVAERITFGKPLIENQALGFELAKMDIEIEAARLLTYKAAFEEDVKDKNFHLTSSKAKYATGEAVKKMALLYYQYCGGMSVSSDSLSSKLLLDALPIPIYEGPSEIQLQILWKHLQQVAKTLK